MSEEFLAACGPHFVRSYFRAWMQSRSGVALVATDDADQRVVGLLLGSLVPAYHYRSMVRTHGAVMGMWLIANAIRRPRWGVQFARTRGIRYLSGLLRLIRRPRAGSGGASQGRHGASAAGGVGEIAHLIVTPAWQGHGLGSGLVQRAAELAAAAELDSLVVVTPPGAAERFYSRLGWASAGEVISRSKVRFIRYELELPTGARLAREPRA